MKPRPPTSRLPIRTFSSSKEVRGLSQNSRILAEQVRNFGLIATPEMSLTEAINYGSCGGTSTDGIQIFLSEGTWDIPAGGFEITKRRVHFVSLSPGRTIFRRTQTPTAPMITASQVETFLHGIRFYDQGTGYPAIKVTAGRCSIDNCYFERVWRAVSLEAGSLDRITDNYVQQNTDSSYVFYLGTGAVSSALVRGNQGLLGLASTFVYADDTVTNSSFCQNLPISGATYVVSYKTGTGCVDAGNVGTVDVRP